MSKPLLRSKILKLRKLKYSRTALNFTKINNLIKNQKIINPIIGGYFPVSYEIDCLEIMKKFEIKKYRLSLPIIKNKNSMEFYSYSKNFPLTINKYGIPEPIERRLVLPNILFVPLVAFDNRLFRIGYGGGYYDRYLNKYKKKRNICSIGFAFSFQEVMKVPNEKFDQKLDFIITEKKIYR